MAALLVFAVSLFFWFSAGASVSAVPGGAAAGDVAALLSFKSSVSVSPPGLLSGWDLAREHHCSWYGVACDGVSGRVVALNLTGGQGIGPQGESSLISGALPAAFGNLTELRVLELPHNAFSGEIPAEIGRLTRLEVLDLRGNNFSGRIPDQISNLNSLHVIDLSDNSFSGQIPNNLIGFSAIRTINLSRNQLSGAIRINRLSRCQSLEYLGLSANLLVGKIPPEIGNCSSLRWLFLDENILEGRIPAEIGKMLELQVLDVSRNSLTNRIPKEISNCKKLQVLVLTNLANVEYTSFGSSDIPRVEFNAFVGGIPWEVFSVPSLEILWAPRANLMGRLPYGWSDSCRLRVLNLAQNYRIGGVIPGGLGMCRNLTFLDLSSNDLGGTVPSQLGVKCMLYLNVSRNHLSGSIPEFAERRCNQRSDTVFEKDAALEGKYYSDLVLNAWANNPFASVFNENFDVLHDFSWNSFVGSLPSFSFRDGFVGTDQKLSYGLLLNNNQFNGSLTSNFLLDCEAMDTIAVNLSVNQIQGGLANGPLSGCLKLRGFEAAYNQLVGSIPLGVGDLHMLSYLDLRGNRLNGSIPDSLEKLKSLKWVFLGGNSLTGEIPSQLGQMTSLVVLDLSRNKFTGHIPPSLTSASKLEILLLNNNTLSGEIPLSFSNLVNLTKLDVSFNDLSGSIPHLKHLDNCDDFQGNLRLEPCPSPTSPPPAKLPVPLQVNKWVSHGGKLKPFAIALVVSASLILLVLVVLILCLVYGRRKHTRQGSIRRKIVVTFTEVPPQVNYDNVLMATEQFSIKYLIGTGGFGSTYRAELSPGFVVAVKRLSIGKFQGLQQFDAEIRTLGRIRHKNLVTLLGYYMGEAETFLIYNYLSGGNLETFIHDRSYRNVRWSTVHKIALDIAQALAYLHDSCIPRIVHRDIKPSNILLDEDLNAYLSDFGLARLLEVSETHATTDVAGTFGYVAPEYATTCRVSDKSDVYSFGVVLFELMSRKKSLDPSFSGYGNGFNIVAWGKMLIKDENFSELLCPDLWEGGPREDLVGMLKLASACTVESLPIRPSMKQVVDRLKQLKEF